MQNFIYGQKKTRGIDKVRENYKCYSGGKIMKVSYDTKNKKTNVEIDVEKLVEKGMDQHEKNWKEKFDTKHKAKKEILEIKHKQKMNLEEKNKTKKNWFQKVVEEKRKIKELELEEQRRHEQKKMITIIVSLVVSICFFVIGAIVDPGYNVIGLLLIIVIGFMLIFGKTKR